MPYQGLRIPIGQRREQVQIQQARTSDDGMGGQAIGAWKTIATPWASVTPLDERDKEALASLQITAKHAYHVAIPYRTGITPAMRMIVRNVPMEIHTVADDEGRRRRLMIQCGEVQA